VKFARHDDELGGMGQAYTDKSARNDVVLLGTHNTFTSQSFGHHFRKAAQSKVDAAKL
jgi:hypothetical protein